MSCSHLAPEDLDVAAKASPREPCKNALTIMTNGIEDIRRKLEEATAKLADVERAWGNYLGNNPNKYRVDSIFLRRTVDVYERTLASMEARKPL